MGSRSHVQLLTVMVSAVVSASVAVAVTLLLAPPYAGAAAGGGVAGATKVKPVNLSSVSKSLRSDFAKSDDQVEALSKLVTTDTGTLQSEIGGVRTEMTGIGSTVEALQSSLGTLQTNVGTLQSNLNGVATSATSAAASSSANASALTTLTPIVQSTAERLYDTCALTGDLWSRSFQNGSTAAWTVSRSGQTADTLAQDLDLTRCYAAGAPASVQGILPMIAEPDQTYNSPTVGH